MVNVRHGLQLRPGNVFKIEAGKQALRNLNSLGLFSNIEVNPVADEKNEGGVIVEINLKEHEHKTADVSTEWNIVCGHGGYPTLVSVKQFHYPVSSTMNFLGVFNVVIMTVLYCICVCCVQASLLPGGTVTFQHQNLNGLNRSLIGSVKTNNLFNPQVQVISILIFLS